MRIGSVVALRISMTSLVVNQTEEKRREVLPSIHIAWSVVPVFGQLPSLPRIMKVETYQNYCMWWWREDNIMPVPTWVCAFSQYVDSSWDHLGQQDVQCRDLLVAHILWVTIWKSWHAYITSGLVNVLQSFSLFWWSLTLQYVSWLQASLRGIAFSGSTIWAASIWSGPLIMSHVVSLGTSRKANFYKRSDETWMDGNSGGTTISTWYSEIISAPLPLQMFWVWS